MPFDAARYFQKSRDLGAQLATHYAAPNARSLIIVTRPERGHPTYLEIYPRPIIQQVSPRLLAAFRDIPDVEIEINDLQIDGISKRYTAEQLVGRGISYLIDAELDDDGQPVGGEAYDLVPGLQLEREQTTFWRLVVRLRSKR